MSLLPFRPGLVFLIGYMASGKTTLGRALSEATGAGFVDLDEYIVGREGLSVPEIFASRGEASFREAERLALRALVDVSASDGCIVACGGGTPCFGDNMDLMNSRGLTVWLDPPTGTIVRRLREDRGGRPLVAALDSGGELEAYVVDNLRRRGPYYGRAAVRFDSSRLESQDEIASSVADFVDMFLDTDHKQSCKHKNQDR